MDPAVNPSDVVIIDDDDSSERGAAPASVADAVTIIDDGDDDDADSCNSSHGEKIAAVSCNNPSGGGYGGKLQAVFTRADKKSSVKGSHFPNAEGGSFHLPRAGEAVESEDKEKEKGFDSSSASIVRRNKVQLSSKSGFQQVFPVSTGRIDEPLSSLHSPSKEESDRAFISGSFDCTGKSKRPRHSAVRDFPEGCGTASPVRDFPEGCCPNSSVPAMRPLDDEGGSVVKDECCPEHGQSSTALNSRDLVVSNRTRESATGDTDENCLPDEEDAVSSPQPPEAVPSLDKYSLEQHTVSPFPRLRQRPSASSYEKQKAKQIHQDPLSKRSKLLRSLYLSGASTPIQGADVKEPVNPNRAINNPLDSGVSARALVKRTLQEFECIRKGLAKGPKTGKRPDIEAASRLKEKGLWRNGEEKIVGEVPGIEVGDQFNFRMELFMIGLHKQVQGGIDFIHGNKRSNRQPLATSIVASGGYEDDDDNGDTFIYTGQGGNNYDRDKRQTKDQELIRGNLALKNSLDERSPVRVIRGSMDPGNPTDRVYTYDGLYDVIDYWFKSGVAGFQIVQFKLVRQPGQAELGSSIVRFVGLLKKKGLARPHLLLEDISGGQERLPICVVNELDGDNAPTQFVYISQMKYPLWYKPTLPKGCDCVGGCVDESKCLCAIKNGGEFPYNDAGYLIRDKQVVYECGSSCRCSSSCQNRVSQRGLRYHLEVFKTKKRGWGVRSLNSIRSGGFICEYTGELLSDAEAEQRAGSDEYLFDLGNIRSSQGNPLALETSQSTALVPGAEETQYAIDARVFGNVARFINHSCSPNLFPQNVLYDSNDTRSPHVILFAMESIPPMRELSYDYNYTVDHVRDANGNVKTKDCYCGAPDCKSRLY